MSSSRSKSIWGNLPWQPDEELRRFIDEYDATNGRMYQDQRRDDLVQPDVKNAPRPLRPRYYGRQASNSLCRVRAQSGLSQAELAARIGSTRKTICRIEASGYEPSVFLALAIAEVLSTKVEDIFRLAALAPVPPSRW